MLDGARTRSPRARVLVVEDNLDVASSMEEVLRCWGHDVAVAHDGSAGLERARAFRPDVILCDIGLPVLDGYGVARAVRAEAALSATHLVAVTAYAAPEDRRRALAAGFDLHLPKPVTIEQLSKVIAASASGDAAPGTTRAA